MRNAGCGVRLARRSLGEGGGAGCLYTFGVDAPLPGADLIARGLVDLARGEETIEALLVSIGAPRLVALGLPVHRPIPAPERRLYDRLSAEESDSAHSRYNALIRRLVSFERAAECESR